MRQNISPRFRLRISCSRATLGVGFTIRHRNVRAAGLNIRVVPAAMRTNAGRPLLKIPWDVRWWKGTNSQHRSTFPDPLVDKMWWVFTVLSRGLQRGVKETFFWEKKPLGQDYRLSHVYGATQVVEDDRGRGMGEIIIFCSLVAQRAPWTAWIGGGGV